MAAGLELLFTLKAKNEAATSIKQVESQIASLKARIKEVSAESSNAPFKTQRLDALRDSLKVVTAHHKELTKATKDSAQAMEQDLSSALGVVSPQLASLVGAAGPVTLVALGFVATAAAAVGLGQALFGTAQQAADFQGKMFDLSQQTGVAVETLSTLEILARTTGGTIESVAQSLVIFQGKLEEAQDSTSDAAEQFKILGIETKNTEEAFRQTLTALSRLPEGFNQTNQAAELFGRRGGKQVLAILKESQGDLDGATKRFRELGIVISEADAKLADEFNDQLAILGFQLRSVGALIGKEVMPVALKAIRDLTKAFNDNRDAINDVAQVAGVLANFFTGPLRGAIFAAQIAWAQLSPALRLVAELYERIAAASQLITGRGLGPGGNIPAISLDTSAVASGVDVSVGGGILRKKRPGGGGGGGGTKTDSRLQTATQAAGFAEREALLITEADIAENKRALEQQTRSIEEFTRRAIELDGLQLEAKIDRITAESNALEDALAKKTIKQAEYETKQRELDIEAAEAHQENKLKTFQRELDLARQLSEERIAFIEREAEIAEDADQREIERTKNKVEQGIITELEGERRIAEITERSFARRKKLLEEEAEAYATSLERRRDITAELIRLDAERAASAEESARRIFDAQNEGARGATREREVFGAPTDVFGELGRVVQESLGLAGEHAQVFGDIITSTFGRIGDAVGSAVHAFVLFGTAQGSFKKFAAEVIASVAQMAAVQAVFELAQALAMLALNFFFPNPKYAASAAAHFQAAAIYGGIAVVATAVGRGVAGNSFNQGGGGGGATGGGGPSTPTRPGEIPVTDINRRGTTQPAINVQVVVRGEAAETFTYRVEKAAVESARGNGVFRKIQNGEDV